MKSLTLLLSIFLVSLGACGSDFQLKGTLEKHPGATLYLDQIKGADIVPVDSAVIGDNGQFVFSKPVKEKDFYRLRLTANNIVFLVLDPAEKIIYTNKNVQLQQDYLLEGSKEGTLILQIKSIRESINSHRDSLVKIMDAATPAQKDSVSKVLESDFNAFVSSRFGSIRNIIVQNPDKLAPIIAAEMLDPDQDFKSFDLLAGNLKKFYPNSGFAQNFINKVEQTRKTAIGVTAPEINLSNPSGTIIPLSSLRGKVVLIDFWASWCGPCRKENPNVVLMYNAYKDKGFDIYSVSLDKDKNNWIKAIEQDKLSWSSHVSDLGYWNSSVVKQYGFSGIPFTVLIDREGKIVAKGLRGPQLEEAISKLLN